MGILMEVIVVKLDSAESQGMLAQGRAYGTTVRAAVAKVALGPPQIWVFGGLVTALVERGQTVGAKTHEELKTKKHRGAGTLGAGCSVHQRQVLRRRVAEVAPLHPPGLEGHHRAGACSDGRSSETRVSTSGRT